MNHTQRANWNVTRLKIAFVVVFAIACAGVWAYTALYAMPRDKCAAEKGVWDGDKRRCAFPPSSRCEAGGGWWDPKSQSCAKVVNVPSVTGRPVKIIQ